MNSESIVFVRLIKVMRLSLPTAVKNALFRYGIITVGDLCVLRDDELLKIRGIGLVRLRIIREEIDRLCRYYGVSLSDLVGKGKA